MVASRKLDVMPNRRRRDHRRNRSTRRGDRVPRRPAGTTATSCWPRRSNGSAASTCSSTTPACRRCTSASTRSPRTCTTRRSSVNLKGPFRLAVGAGYAHGRPRRRLDHQHRHRRLARRQHPRVAVRLRQGRPQRDDGRARRGVRPEGPRQRHPSRPVPHVRQCRLGAARGRGRAVRAAAPLGDPSRDRAARRSTSPATRRASPPARSSASTAASPARCRYAVGRTRQPARANLTARGTGRPRRSIATPSTPTSATGCTAPAGSCCAATGTPTPASPRSSARPGSGTRAFYRHFDSKDELLVSMFSDNAAATARRLADARRSPPARRSQRLHAWIDEILALGDDPRHSEAARMFISPTMPGVFDEAGDEAIASLRAPLRDGARRRRGRRATSPTAIPDADAATIHAIVWRLFTDAIHGRATMDRDARPRPRRALRPPRPRRRAGALSIPPGTRRTHRHLVAPAIDLDAHIDDVVNLLFYEDLHDVIVVGHSYGGMVITGVADRAADRVGKVVYLDAANPVQRPVARRRRRAASSMSPRPMGEARDGVELVLLPGDGRRRVLRRRPIPTIIAWIDARLTAASVGVLRAEARAHERSGDRRRSRSSTSCASRRSPPVTQTMIADGSRRGPAVVDRHRPRPDDHRTRLRHRRARRDRRLTRSPHDRRSELDSRRSTPLGRCAAGCSATPTSTRRPSDPERDDARVPGPDHRRARGARGPAAVR